MKYKPILETKSSVVNSHQTPSKQYENAPSPIYSNSPPSQSKLASRYMNRPLYNSTDVTRVLEIEKQPQQWTAPTPQPSLPFFRPPAQLNIHEDSCYNFLHKRRYKEDPLSHTPLETFFFKESVAQFKIARSLALQSPSPQWVDSQHRRFSRSKKYMLVLDIDETLLHSEMIVERSVEKYHMRGLVYDQKIEFPNPDGSVDVYGVRYRPFLKEFLERMNRIFDLAVYTASAREYAEAILNALDPGNVMFKARLYRENCMQINGMSIKNMQHFIGENAVIVDNLIYSFALHMNQGIPICPFIDDKEDVELKDLAEILERIHLHSGLQNLVENMLGLKDFYQMLEVESQRTGGYSNLSPEIHHAPVVSNERTAQGSLMTSLF